VTATVPLSLLVAFVALRLFDKSLNVISLAGLAFAVGLVMDAAIVTLENIVRCRQNGLDMNEAVSQGTRQITGALFASTVTSVAICRTWIVAILGESLLVMLLLVPKANLLPQAPSDSLNAFFALPPGGTVDMVRNEINIRQLNSQLGRQRELEGSNLVSEFELEQTEANRDLAASDAKLIKVRLRQIDDQIRRADVRAPFTGVVTSRAHRAGEDVARGEVLAQMTDIRNMEVRAFVPLKYLPRTVVGDSIRVFATDTQFEGSIRSLVPTGDIRSQTFEARIDLPVDASQAWTVGQLVSVGIPIRSGELSLAIPRDALVLRQDGSYVYRINADNKAERINVETGDSSGGLIAVSGALNEGDRVAVRGAENLREGADVRILLSNNDSLEKRQEG